MTRVEVSDQFAKMVQVIPTVGLENHSSNIVQLAEHNKYYIRKSIRDLPAPTGTKASHGVVINAGPSVYRRQSIKTIKDSDYAGSVICVDGSFIASLRGGVVPDYVVSLDPHHSRIIRWFGDPDFEANSKNDDYYARQDLDVTLRESLKRNQEDIELVNRFAGKTKVILSTTAPNNVVKRLVDAGYEIFWWNPLVDNPNVDGLSRALYSINPIPFLNTGGTVGTAAWLFGIETLKLKTIGIVGMDLGYYADTPYKNTQHIYEIFLEAGQSENIDSLFPRFVFPLTGQEFYTDPTYYWYRANFLELMEVARHKCRTVNLTEGGTFYGPNIELNFLKSYLLEHSVGKSIVHQSCHP
jgi:hypothetical protein